MSTALGLLIFIGIFALAIGLFGSFVGTTNSRKVKVRAEHESRLLARQPWDVQSSRDRGNR